MNTITARYTEFLTHPLQVPLRGTCSTTRLRYRAVHLCRSTADLQRLRLRARLCGIRRPRNGGRSTKNAPQGRRAGHPGSTNDATVDSTLRDLPLDLPLDLPFGTGRAYRPRCCATRSVALLPGSKQSGVYGTRTIDHGRSAPTDLAQRHA